MVVQLYLALVTGFTAYQSDTADDASWLTEVQAFLISFWNLQLFEVDDQPITVGKIMLVGLLLVLGVTLSRRLSLFLCRSVLSHLNLSENTRIVIERGITYLFLLVFTMLAGLACEQPAPPQPQTREAESKTDAEAKRAHSEAAHNIC